MKAAREIIQLMIGVAFGLLAGVLVFTWLYGHEPALGLHGEAFALGDLARVALWPLVLFVHFIVWGWEMALWCLGAIAIVVGLVMAWMAWDGSAAAWRWRKKVADRQAERRRVSL